MRKKNQFDPNHGKVVGGEEESAPAPAPKPTPQPKAAVKKK